MIHEQASRLAAGLVRKRVIDEDSHEVYTYGFELIISALINILIMAAVSIMLRRYYDWLLFLLAFIPLRTTAGGYHAGSHMKCTLVGTIGFAAVLAVCRLQIDWRYAILATAILSFLLILLLSPVEAHNKKLNEKRRKKNRTASICIGIVNMLVGLAAFFTRGMPNVLSIYFAGVFSAALSMLVVKIHSSRREGKS